jgi:hypothetical protein
MFVRKQQLRQHVDCAHQGQAAGTAAASAQPAAAAKMSAVQRPEVAKSAVAAFPASLEADPAFFAVAAVEHPLAVGDIILS